MNVNVQGLALALPVDRLDEEAGEPAEASVHVLAAASSPGGR